MVVTKATMCCYLQHLALVISTLFGCLQQLVVDPKGAVIVRTWCRQLQQCAVSSEILPMAGHSAPWETILYEFENICYGLGVRHHGVGGG